MLSRGRTLRGCRASRTCENRPRQYDTESTDREHEKHKHTAAYKLNRAEMEEHECHGLQCTRSRLRYDAQSSMTPLIPQQMQGDSSPSPLRKRRRGRYFLGALVLIGIALFTLTRSSVLCSIILPRLSTAFGGTVNATAIHLDGFSSLSVKDFELRVAGWEGDSARIAFADRITIRFSPWVLLKGNLLLREIKIDTLTVRLAERLEDPGTFNIFALTPPPDDASKPSAERPAAILINRLAFENGVESEGQWKLAGRIDVQGELHPSVGVADELDVRLEGLATERGPAPFETIHGRFNLRTNAFNVEVDELKVREESLALAPMAARKLLDQLDLEGSVERAAVSFDGSSPPAAELYLRNMRISFPVEELGGEWTGYALGKVSPTTGRPRIDVREGTLKLTKNSLTLENLVGNFSASNPSQPVLSVPVQASASIVIPTDDLPAFRWADRDAWFKSALTAAKIDAQVSVRNFSSPPAGDPRVLFVPRGVAQAFEDFAFTKWTVDIETEAHRATGTPTSAGAVLASGEVRLSDAAGAYKEFAYPVDQVTALMRFEGDTVKIVRLNGRGSDNAEVEMSGSLTSLATGAEIELSIRSKDTPLDARLIGAFDAEARQALEHLFDADAVASLAAAELLPDAKWLLQQEAQLARLSADAGAEIERLKRSIAAGPFKLGGRADLDIRVYSPPGFGTEVQTTGSVTIHAAGLACTQFPYPLRIETGVIAILDESVVLSSSGAGLQGVTPVGGSVVVAGNIEIKRTTSERLVVPNVTLDVSEDTVNLALLAAIPFDIAPGTTAPEGWPGRVFAPAGELLRSIGLGGTFSAKGTITDESRGNFAFEIALRDGQVEPNAAGVAWLASQKLPWPPDFTLDRVEAKLLMNGERIELSDCTARRGEGTASITGEFALQGPNSRVAVTFERIPLDRAFEPMLDADATKAAAFWQRYQPSGELDGSFDRSTSAKGTTFQASIIPRFIEVSLDEERVRAELITGRINAAESNLQAEDLGFRLRTGTRDDGLLRLSGVLDGSSALNATLTNGRFESPVVRAALRDQSSDTAELLARSKTTGLFDAKMTGAAELNIELQPKSIAFDHHAMRSEFTFTPTSSITLAKNQIVGDCTARFDDGNASAKFKVSIENNALRSLSLTGSLDSASFSPAMRVLLTPPVESIVDNIGFSAEGRSSIRVDQLELAWNTGSPLESPDALDIRAICSTVDAKFDVGPQLEAFEGTANIIAHQVQGASPEDSFRVEIQATNFKAFSRDVGRSEGIVARAAPGADLTVDASGDFLGGRWSTNATVDAASNQWRAHIRAANANYSSLASPKLETMQADRTGRVNLSTSLEGLLDDGQATDRGRGRISVRGAVIAKSPLLMRVAALSQLMLPLSGAFDEADASLAIQGDLAYIDPLQLRSPSIKLDGLGTLRLTDYAVAIQLRASGRLGLLSELLAGVTHSLFGIQAGGTLEDPKVSLAPLAGIFNAFAGNSTSTASFPLPPAPTAAPPTPETPSAPKAQDSK